MSPENIAPVLSPNGLSEVHEVEEETVQGAFFGSCMTTMKERFQLLTQICTVGNESVKSNDCNRQETLADTKIDQSPCMDSLQHQTTAASNCGKIEETAEGSGMTLLEDCQTVGLGLDGSSAESVPTTELQPLPSSPSTYNSGEPEIGSGQHFELAHAEHVTLSLNSTTSEAVAEVETEQIFTDESAISMDINSADGRNVRVGVYFVSPDDENQIEFEAESTKFELELDMQKLDEEEETKGKINDDTEEERDDLESDTFSNTENLASDAINIVENEDELCGICSGNHVEYMEATTPKIVSSENPFAVDKDGEIKTTILENRDEVTPTPELSPNTLNVNSELKTVQSEDPKTLNDVKEETGKLIVQVISPQVGPSNSELFKKNGSKEDIDNPRDDLSESTFDTENKNENANYEGNDPPREMIGATDETMDKEAISPQSMDSKVGDDEQSTFNIFENEESAEDNANNSNPEMSVLPLSVSKLNEEIQGDFNLEKSDGRKLVNSCNSFSTPGEAGTLSKKTCGHEMAQPTVYTTPPSGWVQGQVSPAVGDIGESSPTSIDDKEQKQFRKTMLLVLDRISSLRHASLFLKPVSEKDAPGYAEVIKQPMDLATIKDNLKRGVINTLDKFERNVNLIFLNCNNYNRQDLGIIEMSHEMETEVQDIFKENREALQFVEICHNPNYAVRERALRRHGRYNAASTPTTLGFSSSTVRCEDSGKAAKDKPKGKGFPTTLYNKGRKRPTSLSLIIEDDKKAKNEPEQDTSASGPSKHHRAPLSPDIVTLPTYA